MRIAVLGAGMVGRTIAVDLCERFDVSSFDRSQPNLDLLDKHGIKTVCTDLSHFQNFSQLLAGYDMAVSAVPGFMGFETLNAVINAGLNVVDISFFPEDALELDALAKERQVTAIVDCGVAPGMSNLILGRYNEELTITSFECMVGGLPKLRTKPFEYKAPFSPVDVIEEYTRPARYVENGHLVTKPALSDAELIDFPIVGTLEAFNTDGLRSLLFTMSHIPDLKEKTLRYPGHIALIQSLKQAGFFNETAITVEGNSISPLQFTSRLLFDSWKLEAGDEEFTIMTIRIRGDKSGEAVTIDYFLYDEYDNISNTSSMSRTTGFTCAAAVNLLADNLFSKAGVFPPELIGADKNCFEYILAYLDKRNVKWLRS